MTYVQAIILAAITSLLASVILYLGSPNQQWMQKRPVLFRHAFVVWLLLCVMSWTVMRLYLGALSASFTLMSMQMLALGIIPFVARLSSPVKVKGLTQRFFNLQKIKEGPAYRALWWSRILGAVLLCFPMALSLVGLFAWWGPGGISDDVKSQLIMWMITPVFIIPLSLVFLVVNVRRLLMVLAACNLIFYSLLFLVAVQDNANANRSYENL
ncbi:hypothetical protein TDB9533_00189 [Thalassocella blandensis]|nr:hypothetical protein TDB9533_00189 [Thalassocella blandensis]